MDYRREIDGLRAVAVLPVIFFHAGLPAFPGGFVGVDVFFVISGYLITTIILTEKRAGTFSLLNFYERRVRRILPALFLMLAACLPAAWLLLMPDDLRRFANSMTAVSVFASNILFWQETGYFNTAGELKPLLHTWSLAVEEQYYLLFPLLVLLSANVNRRTFTALLAFFAVISLATAQWQVTANPEAAFFLLPTRAWELLAGALTAIYLLDRPSPGVRQPLVRQALGLAGLALIVFSVAAFSRETPFPGLHALVPVSGAALIILFAARDTWAGRALGSPALAGMGLISYSAYLWHQPLFAFARHAAVGMPKPHHTALLICTTLSLAYLSWRFVEKPFRTKGTVTRRTLFCFAAAASVSFAVIGGVASLKEGFPDRAVVANAAALQEVNRLGEERQLLIRAGICHYNERAGVSLDHFLSHWDCYDDPAYPQLKRIPLIITGDSHSADKVVSLKLNGYVPLQLGGASCSLNPKAMKPECTEIFNLVKKIISTTDSYEYIAIANSFTTEELTPEALKETIDFWQGFGKKLIFFTGMPEFTDFKRRLGKAANISTDLSIAKLSSSALVRTYLESRGVHVIDTADLFCPPNSQCDYKDDNARFMLTDNNHLSRYGAKYFGEQLLRKDAIFREMTTGGITPNK